MDFGLAFHSILLTPGLPPSDEQCHPANHRRAGRFARLIRQCSLGAVPAAGDTGRVWRHPWRLFSGQRAARHDPPLCKRLPADSGYDDDARQLTRHPARHSDGSGLLATSTLITRGGVACKYLPERMVMAAADSLVVLTTQGQPDAMAFKTNRPGQSCGRALFPSSCRVSACR